MSLQFYLWLDFIVTLDTIVTVLPPPQTYRLNDQIRPITELLKFVEKVNLAPDVLEPEPSSIKQVCTCL